MISPVVFAWCGGTLYCTCRNAALCQVLPGGADRLPYAELRETIFKSRGTEIPAFPNKDADLSTSTRNGIRCAPAEVVLRQSLITTLLNRVRPIAAALWFEAAF